MAISSIEYSILKSIVTIFTIIMIIKLITRSSKKKEETKPNKYLKKKENIFSMYCV